MSRFKLTPGRLVGDHHFVNVVAFGALKGSEVEARAYGHDAGEHHVGLALWAGRAMDLNVDVVGQGTRFRHDASLEEAGAQRSLSPICAWQSRGDGASIDHRVPSSLVIIDRGFAE
jgi:hypothetical protein